MNTRAIFITETDRTRLLALLDNPVLKRESSAMRDLVAEMQRAVIVPSREVPPDVVTMRSRVNVRDRTTGEVSTITLVFPNEASMDDGKISVLAPIGVALIGYRIGDAVAWKVPSGMKEFEITGIEYQPEAAGEFHL
ncbi:MAG: nucleoside diphosphate kinase regulator [Bacteroidetes bacterium]|nr:nucleoside diphosphate kinase regulator [Bacteroidota bacterium]